MKIKKAKKALKHINRLFEAVNELEERNTDLMREKRLFEERYFDAEHRVSILETLVEEVLLDLRECEAELNGTDIQSAAFETVQDNRPILRLVNPVALAS
ncbi:hypothetical protein [Planktotalea sp.]|uniref:hypothetical protein n=1 Tax=Planktotalea sp. TaxID=2029877 RepID=UPI003F6AC735